MGDISRFEVLEDVSDEEVNEVHYDERCEYGQVRKTKRINGRRYVYFILYRMCFCRANLDSYDPNDYWFKWKDFPMDGVVLHGEEDCEEKKEEI